MESYSNTLENKHKSKLKSNCKSLYLFKILEKHQIKYRYTCIYMQYSTYRDIDMTVIKTMNKKRTYMVTSMIFSGKKVNIFKDVGNLMQKQIPENLSFSNLT
jgi:hypothetical protein